MNKKKRLDLIHENGMKRSVTLNFLLKPVGMIISLLYTPLLLRFLGNEQNGIWVTILSIINWINYFDVGIGNGLRNQLTVEVTKRKYDEAKQSISTAYIVMTGLVFLIFFIAIAVGMFINWGSVLNTKLTVEPALLISFTFICINFVLSLQKIAYFAIQKSELVALSGVITQCVNLVGVFLFILIGQSDKGNKLTDMAILFGVSSLAVNILFSVLTWRKNSYMVPSVKLFKRNKLKGICSLGFKFFFIQIAGLILFTTDSLIISKLFSPEFVTPYNTIYRAFGVAQSVFIAILTPFWSRFTVAKQQEDYHWMRTTINKMVLLWIIFSIAIIGITPLYQTISDVWLGRHLNYDTGIVPLMAIYYIAYIYSSICSTVLNGLGEVNVQMISSVIAAILNIPLSVFFAVNCKLATAGICLGTVISLLIGDVLYTIQIHYILKREKTS